ncbi:ATP-dependent nuclease [Solimonas marina]|uniref:ATP-binding protein n=1 Tax=Solimonas marina TaxID=2714601 RepID=A0A970B355_9GAMM|nr:AAA family ATPase [Solimonas marina]NKF20872.1 ATP-binding protein [Solimonas marina]
MRLKSITTKNYRTLHDLTLTFANNYCTISGRNNAGKSCVIRLLSALFRAHARYPWQIDESGLDYKDDKTQWVKDTAPIVASFGLDITRHDDPALISFIEKIASKKIEEQTANLTVEYAVSDSDEITVSICVNGERVDDKAAKEIDKRIKDSNLLFLYNSTTRHDDFIFGRGRRRMFYEFVMSTDERKALEEAGKHIERRLRKLAKDHTEGLSKILGRLTEKYDVEVSPLEGFAAREMPLGINLKDKNVEVPLSDWGSGTQNRTHILMAVLQANRIKTTGSPDDKITPVVVIEEPESFLHPSAQAEFGRMLRHLSEEFGIQILVTTHSPHMLNQEDGESNILLTRETKRGRAYESVRVDTSGENWMAPFADHLGISSEDFSCLKPLFSADKSKVLLVEGPIDQEYFRFFQEHSLACDRLSGSIEVVPYGGKDTLKNTLLIQFVLRKFDRVFVTYDLDAAADVRAALGRVGLKESTDYIGLGVSQAGKDCIEGLLPQSVLSAVNGRETDLIMKLGSKDNSERRKAKDALKKLYLAEFKAKTDHTKEDLKELAKVVRLVNTRLNAQQGVPADAAAPRR